MTITMAALTAHSSRSVMPVLGSVPTVRVGGDDVEVDAPSVLVCPVTGGVLPCFDEATWGEGDTVASLPELEAGVLELEPVDDVGPVVADGDGDPSEDGEGDVDVDGSDVEGEPGVGLSSTHDVGSPFSSNHPGTFPGGHTIGVFVGDEAEGDVVADPVEEVEGAVVDGVETDAHTRFPGSPGTVSHAGLSPWMYTQLSIPEGIPVVSPVVMYAVPALHGLIPSPTLF